MKRCVAVICIIFCLGVSVLPAFTRVSLSGDVDIGWGLIEDSKAKGMGVAGEINYRLGYDFTSWLTAFGELGMDLMSPSVNNASFVNVPSRLGMLFGGGCAFSFGHGMSVSLSGGIYYNNLGRNNIEMNELGLYANIKPRILLFSMLPNDSFYNFALSLPFSVFWTGNGYQMKLSVGFGVDCSAYGKRN